jgi:hypothetical protein
MKYAYDKLNTKNNIKQTNNIDKYKLRDKIYIENNLIHNNQYLLCLNIDP